MKKKLLLFSCVSVLFAASCAKEISEPGGLVTVTASMEENGKTILDEDGVSVLWEAQDEMELFFNGTGSKFVSTNTTPAGIASFSGSLNSVISLSEGFTDSTPLWGLYPYCEDASADNNYVTTTLPDAQIGRAGSFAKGTFITLSKSTTLSMGFYNVCGGIRFSLTKEGVKEVIIKSAGGKSLAGKVKLGFEGVPVVDEVISGKDSIILSAPSATGFETGKWYYITILPVTLSEGFTLTFNTDTQYASLTTTKSFEIKRGTIGSLPLVDQNADYKDRPVKDFTTLSELAAQATTTSSTFSCKLKDAVVTYKIGAWCHIEDNSGAFLYYRTTSESAFSSLEVGDMINGSVSGKMQLNKNSIPEFTTLTISSATVTKAASIPCSEITLEELDKNYEKYLSCRLLIKGVTVEKGISSGKTSARTGSISQGSKTFTIYGTYSSSPAVIETDKVGNLICFPSYYSSNRQLNVYRSSDFEEGGSTEDTAFTKLTTVGIYDLTDAENPSPIYVPGSGVQSCSMTYSDTRRFNMLSLSEGYAIKSIFDSISLAAGSSTTVHISTRGTSSSISSVPTGDFSVVVAKKSGKTVWARTTDSTKGFIITIE